MDDYSRAFKEALSALPQTLLADILKKKIDALGIKLTEWKIHLLAEKILKGEPINSTTLIDQLKRSLALQSKRQASN